MKFRSSALRCALLISMYGVSASAMAGTAAIGNATAPTTGGGTTPPVLPITYAGDGTTDGFETTVAFDAARFDATVAGANGGSCSVNNTTGVITALFQDGALNPLPTTATAYCNVTFTAVAGTAGVFPLNVANTLQSNDGGPSGQPLTETDGSITVQAGPTAPQLTFTPPAPGPITIGATGAGSIAVSAGAGSAGETAALACTSTNGTATVTGSPFAPNSSGSVAVQCTPAVGAGVAFTVTCTPDQSTGTDQAAQVFNATCPGITPQPEISAVTTVSLFGAPGTVLTGGAAIQNTGNAPLTVGPCTVTGAFTVTPPAGPIAAGGSGTLGVSCTAPGAAGATATGSASCTTNDADENPTVFALSCNAQVLSVPTMGSFGKGIMIALLAGLGLLGFAMRRRAV